MQHGGERLPASLRFTFSGRIVMTSLLKPVTPTKDTRTRRMPWRHLIRHLKHLTGAAIVMSSAAVGQAANNPLLMAHFMPWYQTPGVHGYWGWHWTMDHFNPEILDQNGHREVASHFYPLTGPYDSDDPDILEYQTLLMSISGIDGVLVDWWGMDNFADYAVMNESTMKLLSAIERAHLSFALVYEDQTIQHMIDYGALRREDALNHGKMVMSYAEQHWFESNSYLRLNGSPVLLNFGPEYFMMSSDWDTLFTVFSIPPLFFTLIDPLTPVAAGAYPWPPMKDCNAQGILTQSALNTFLDWFYGQAAGWPYLIAGAFPGFHDIYQEAGVWPSLGYLDAMDGYTFRSTLKQALNHHPDVIQLITWNDYGEGTIIEPTEEFGYQYLEIVQATKDSLDPAFPFQKEDLGLPLQMYNARVQYAKNVEVNSVLDRVYALIISKQRNSAVALMDSLSQAITAAIIDPAKKSSGGYFLGQNYPNPFNPTTVIGCQWPAAGKVRLVVYDILGRPVATVADGRYPAGKYSFTFDAKNLAGGVYFYRLQVGDFTQTRRLILLR
jgi:hypothetical protein